MTQEQEQIKIDTAELKAARLAQWKGAVEQELQKLVGEASGIREKIDTAKTEYKKVFYRKKFKKVQEKVLQMVGALQRIQVQEATDKEKAAQPSQQADTAPEAPHVHDENCHHDHVDTASEAPAT